jgi:hypothetical protein
MAAGREFSGLQARLDAAHYRLGHTELSIIPSRTDQQLGVPSDVRLVTTPPNDSGPDLLELIQQLNSGVPAGVSPHARLEYDWDADWFLDPFNRSSVPVKGCLEQFIRLGQAPAERIAAFAKKWGLPAQQAVQPSDRLLGPRPR